MPTLNAEGRKSGAQARHAAGLRGGKRDMNKLFLLRQAQRQQAAAGPLNH
jgi:hypothetical protein